MLNYSSKLTICTHSIIALLKKMDNQQNIGSLAELMWTQLWSTTWIYAGTPSKRTFYFYELDF